MDKIHEATKNYIKSDIPDFNSGDTVAVDVKVREGNKERVQSLKVLSSQDIEKWFRWNIYSQEGN